MNPRPRPRVTTYPTPTRFEIFRPGNLADLPEPTQVRIPVARPPAARPRVSQARAERAARLSSAEERHAARMRRYAEVRAVAWMLVALCCLLALGAATGLVWAEVLGGS